MGNNKNGVREKIYNYLMEYLKLCLTHKLGKVVEEEDKLVCYVSQKKVRELNRAIVGRRSDYDSLAVSNGLNKPIVYVFNKINFEGLGDRIRVYEKCDLIFNDCKFDYNQTIFANRSCNITINDCSGCGSLYISSAKCVNINGFKMSYIKRFTISADEIILEKLDDSQSEIYVDNSTYDLRANYRIDIIDSFIGNKAISTFLNAGNEINVINSTIGGMNFTCIAHTVNFNEKSSIFSSGTVKIDSQNEVKPKIQEPIVIINGESISKENDYVKTNSK